MSEDKELDIKDLRPVVQTPWPSIWGNTNQQSLNTNVARAMYSTDHGMYAGVPMICKGGKCAYKLTCMIPDADLQVGNRCPIEIAAIMERFEKWCKSLDINPDDDRNTVDLGYVKDLVDIEIMMVRADARMAISADFIEEVVAAVAPDGTAYMKKQVDETVKLKAELRRDRQKILNELAASRKAKQASLKGLVDASTAASQLMQRVKQLQQEGMFDEIIDADVVEAGDK